MKQYTAPDQTAKLIELGFEKPKGSHSYWRGNELVININYSIGELIEMLPSALSPNNDEDREFHLMLFDDSLYWHVRYTDGENLCCRSLAIELIDALYDMIIVLREKGII